ncbi:choloylglycine hydrolase family protein [Desulfosporosinus youngiae]|uniref:Penicillin V acylase-like amidase n=1 Tax=Desulfosporosinus youngiae DSM 17734 TaxID=768710 RepID=H5XW29_9FIRM|nr:choloylglycine hydrolase family protein [Desulfosporosinus youngiae]EHQ90481.1 penicillin V acylase-like amidase [Desulfosporosinus youngiae DSM 17734]
MCTAMTLKTQQGEIFLGRTMDFSYVLNPHLYTMPRNYQWSNALGTVCVRNRYSYIGVGQTIPKITFADGVNEMGLAAAALYFSGYAKYREPECGAQTSQFAATELVNFLLGMCGSVEEAAFALQSVRIVGVPDAVTNSVAPLHWIVCDKKGQCLTVEQTKNGMHLLANHVGVLSNSPTFEWHMENLRNYMRAAPHQPEGITWGELVLTPFGQGGGTEVLPGGYTPPARFVRTVFQKTHVPIPQNRQEAVVTGFHILEGVSIPQGVVLTSRGTYDYTQYTVFMNTATCEYFVRTYENSQVFTAKLSRAEAEAKVPVSLGKLVRPATFEKL